MFPIYTLVIVKSYIFWNDIEFKGKTKFIFYSSLLSLILNLVLNYYFINYSVYIACNSYLLSIAIVQFAQLIATSKIVNITIRSIFRERTCKNHFNQCSFFNRIL